MWVWLLGGVVELWLFFVIFRGWDWDVEVGVILYVCVFQVFLVKMVLVEYVVVDVGVFLWDVVLQVQGVLVERSGVWVGDFCRIVGNWVGVSWVGFFVGYWEEYLYYLGCDQ